MLPYRRTIMKPTLYLLLNDKQKSLYGRITMELDDFEEDITLEEVKEVYAVLMQDPEVSQPTGSYIDDRGNERWYADEV
jgi:hypothetical protein